MNADERAERDQKVLQLFLAGATYRQIGAAVGLSSTQSIHRIVRREMASTDERRAMLTDEAQAVHQERTEALFKANWGAALRGDVRAAEICRRLLDQQARQQGEPAKGWSKQQRSDYNRRYYQSRKAEKLAAVPDAPDTPGPVETGVLAEVGELGVDRPGLVAGALQMARILDTPLYVSQHAAALKRLEALLAEFHKLSGARGKKLASVRKLTVRAS